MEYWSNRLRHRLRELRRVRSYGAQEGVMGKKRNGIVWCCNFGIKLFNHRDVPRNLLDPVFSGIPRHAGDMNLSNSDDYEKQDIVSDKPGGCNHLGSEEIAGGEDLGRWNMGDTPPVFFYRSLTRWVFSAGVSKKS